MNFTKIIISAFLIIFSVSAFADVYVPSYQRSEGTVVQDHYKSNPDGDRNNNWSTEGNRNPHTGKEGTLPRDNYR